MNGKLIRTLTPENTWSCFVTSSVEMFVSNFYLDRYGLGKTDYKKMCQIYANDLPVNFKQPFLQEDLDYIADLLEKHIKNYTERIGGEENLQLLTEEDIN